MAIVVSLSMSILKFVAGVCVCVSVYFVCAKNMCIENSHFKCNK